MSGEVRAIFEPKSVVLVGASAKERVGTASPVFFGSLVHNTLRFFKGKTHVVDFSGRLDGAVKNLDQVPSGCDIAVIVLPPKLVMKNLRKLFARKVKAMVLVAGGFDQHQLEELTRAAAKQKVRVLGPNVLAGVINTTKGLCITLERGLMPPCGGIAMISQNCAVGTAMLDRACSYSVGVSKFASIGEGADITETDLLEFLTHDKETKVICIYLESVRDGRRFLESIREAVQKKPVVVLKGSTVREGVERNRIFVAALKQVGALQVSDIEELLSVADALAKQPCMRGNRVAVVTNVSGPAVLVADVLSREGLALAKLSDNIMKKIIQKYPNINIADWVDLGIDANGDRYKFVLEQVLSDSGVDGVVVVNELKSTFLKLEDVQEAAKAVKKSKNTPVIDIVMCGEDCVLVRNELRDKDVCVYDSPRKAARALCALCSYGKILKKVGK
ncbi:MAG: hypothetical protein AVW05_02180 [Hadesarchaea archaeon DG-33]|nr:MAG: hypothetical protein AVW05_02180 [Hadesarchaea archaeon DG-33]